ncbi:Sugar phosphate transporter domain-containing protein [Plasmodiophora brassicae]
MLPSSPATRRRLIVSVSAASLYAVVSIALTLLNKALFYSFAFSQTRILGLGQFVSAIVFLQAFSAYGLVTLPRFSIDVVGQIWPLSASYLIMVVCGFAAMRGTNLVMFGVLRRTGIILVLVLEYVLLNNRPTRLVVMSTVVMVLGVVVAGAADLSYDPVGYLFAFITNLATAIYIVLIKFYKETLNLDAFGMLFYNAILSTPVLVVISLFNHDFADMADFEDINNAAFWCVFILSCSLGFAINYSVFLNTSVNSPLTQTVTGQLKDILVLLLGVVIFRDTPFSALNAFGVTLSVIGSIVYASVKYGEMSGRAPHRHASPARSPMESVKLVDAASNGTHSMRRKHRAEVASESDAADTPSPSLRGTGTS